MGFWNSRAEIAQWGPISSSEPVPNMPSSVLFPYLISRFLLVVPFPCFMKLHLQCSVSRPSWLSTYRCQFHKEFLECPLIFYCCFNKLLRTLWLKTAPINYCTVLEVRSSGGHGWALGLGLISLWSSFLAKLQSHVEELGKEPISGSFKLLAKFSPLQWEDWGPCSSLAISQGPSLPQRPTIWLLTEPCPSSDQG